jgi:hypothetical protein
MKYLEHELQCNCVKWFKLQYPHEIIFAIPNAKKLSLIQGSRLKKEGLLSGVCDLFIAKANINSNGLFIEMKIKNNKPSENQKLFMQKVEKKGYECYVCYSFDEFINIVKKYINN